MSVSTMEDLFHDTLRDVYYAEKQLLKALPGMARKARTPELKEAIETHRDETETHVERLEQVFELLGKTARGKKCPAMDGLIEEGKEHMEEAEEEAVRDAGIIASAQAVEHYEIARYGTLVSWAQQIGNRKAASLLTQTLEEEKKTDQLLSGLAERQVNRQAA